MTCKHTDAGCNSPQSECAGLCSGMKFYPKPIPMVVEYAEPEPPLPLQWIEWAAMGAVALLALVAILAFNAHHFF